MEETVKIDKEYILNRMKVLEQTQIMQEYIYLQKVLLASDVKPTESKEVVNN